MLNIPLYLIVPREMIIQMSTARTSNVEISFEINFAPRYFGADSEHEPGF